MRRSTVHQHGERPGWTLTRGDVEAQGLLRRGGPPAVEQCSERRYAVEGGFLQALGRAGTAE